MTCLIYKPSAFPIIFPVDDASGRYTTGFFYGNNYYMGSMSLCTSIFKDDEDICECPQWRHFIAHKFNSFPIFDAFAVRANKGPKNEGLSFLKTYTAENRRTHFEHENPPFFPAFFVLRVLINETTILPVVRTMNTIECTIECTGIFTIVLRIFIQARTIYIGMCLPTACQPDEVLLMAQVSQQQTGKFNIGVEAVRSPTQTPYDYWADNTFLLLV